MYDDWKELIATEMQRGLDEVMEEIESDPAMKDVEAPEDMYDNVMAMIDEHERQKIYEQLSDEDKELIQLGKVYKKQRKFDKFVVVLAAVIVGLGIGSVCIGEDENILNFVSRMFSNRDQDVVNSDGIEPITYIDEDEVYEEIETTYGFTPVKLRYLPKNIAFQEAILGTDIQGINMFYGVEDKANIIYIIRPGYRESSFAMDMEDKKIQEYLITVCDVEIKLQEFLIEKSGENRWSINFTYHDVQYLLRVTDMKQEEVEKIVNELYFMK